MAQHGTASYSGQDSAAHLHLKEKGHSFKDSDVHITGAAWMAACCSSARSLLRFFLSFFVLVFLIFFLSILVLYNYGTQVQNRVQGRFCDGLSPTFHFVYVLDRDPCTAVALIFTIRISCWPSGAQQCSTLPNWGEGDRGAVPQLCTVPGKDVTDQSYCP